MKVVALACGVLFCAAFSNLVGACPYGAPGHQHYYGGPQVISPHKIYRGHQRKFSQRRYIQRHQYYPRHHYSIRPWFSNPRFGYRW
ncbi:MAG: hypothetical protein AAF384_05065 [Pseudomonadota bacterium]